MTDTQTAGERHPDYIRAIFDRAVKMIEEGRLDSAEVLLETLRREPSATEAAAYLRGVIASRRMEKAAAQSFFRTALEANPYNADAHAQLGRLLLDDQPVGSVAAFAAALALDSRNADWHVGLAEALGRLGFVDFAKNSLTEALARAPTHPRATELAASLSVDAREIDGLSTEDEAILCNALFAEATRLLGDGDLARAKAIYERVLARAPEHCFSLVNLGALTRELGDLERSQTLLERALAVDPTLTPAHLAMAETCLVVGRTQDARSHFETAIALEPQGAAPCAAYAMALQKMGEPKEAIPLFHRAILIDQNQPAEFYAALGAALEAMGMSDRAQIALQHAAALTQAS